MRQKVVLLLLLSLPFFYALFELFLIGAIDPIKYIYTLSGYTALTLLLLTTTLSLLNKQFHLVKYRKMLGLASFFYSFIHFVNFLVLDMELDVSFAITETFDKPFIYLGVISFVILALMASTSTPKTFKRFHSYHKFIYLGIILATTHFVMAQKSLSIPQWAFLGVIILIGFFKLKQLFHRVN